MSGNNTGYIFGRNNVVEALKSDRQIDKIFVADGSGGSIGKIITIASDKHIPIIRINQSKLDNKFPGENHQGVVAVVAVKEYSTVDDILELAKERQEAPFIVIADEIADPHNLGAIIRSAECFGAHGVIISKRRAVGLTASVEKAAGGALNYLPVAKVVNLAAAVEDLKTKGVWVYCCDMDGKNTYYEQNYDGGVALVVGSEGNGVSSLLKKKCDFVVSIPMCGKVPCLNASVAASVVMQEIAKNRRV